ncbi:MAG: hypothetical protein U0360_11775 [Dehalococcoidia bacterium]
MRIWSASLAAALVITLTSTQPVTNLEASAVTAWLQAFQSDVRRDDRAAVAARMQFPLTVFAGGLRIPVADADAFIAKYDVVVTPALKSALAAARVATAGPASSTPVTIHADAVSIGRDLLTVSLVDGALKVTRMTVPLAPGVTEPASSPPSTAPARRAPRTGPVRLVVGLSPVRRAGALAVGARDTFVLAAKRAQRLEVRVIGVSGRDVVAYLTRAATGAPLDPRAQDGVRTWVGRVPDDGDYRIDVVRLSDAGGARQPYTLVVELH